MEMQELLDLINSDQPLMVLAPTLQVAPGALGTTTHSLLITGISLAYINLPVPDAQAEPVLYSVCEYAAAAIKASLDQQQQTVKITNLTPKLGWN